MAPAKNTMKTEDDAKATNKTVMSQFFKRKNLGRRPFVHALFSDSIEVARSRKKKRGPVPRLSPSDRTKKSKAYTAHQLAPETIDQGTPDVCPSILKPEAKVKRTNWAQGEPLRRLTKAVQDWDGATTDKVSLRSYAVSVDIHFVTLQHYACEDKNKRKKLGSTMRRKPLLNSRDQYFVRNVLARQDRANEGSNVQEAIDLVTEVNPKLTQQQARFHLCRTFLKCDSSIVKSKAVVAQQTTTKQSNITVPQQYRWHMIYESALSELRTRNTGVC